MSTVSQRMTNQPLTAFHLLTQATSLQAYLIKLLWIPPARKYICNQYRYIIIGLSPHHLSYSHSIFLPPSFSLSCQSTYREAGIHPALLVCPDCCCDERCNLQGNVFRCHWPDSVLLFADRIQRFPFSGIMGTPSIPCICACTHHQPIMSENKKHGEEMRHCTL